MGLDNFMDQLEARKRTIDAQAVIIGKIKDAIAQDQNIDANREQAKAVTAQAHADALGLSGEGLAADDRQLFIDQVAGIRDSLS